MPSLPDHWAIIEEADDAHPFRLATSPSRNFLNSSFTETLSSKTREGNPSVMMHPADAAAHGLVDGDIALLGNERGETELTVKLFEGLRRGVLIAEFGAPQPCPYRRAGHQCVDRRRGDRAARWSRLPRQQGMGKKGGRLKGD